MLKLYYVDKNWHHFIKEYLEYFSKFTFQEVARLVGRLNRHILEILLACRHTLVAQNLGARELGYTIEVTTFWWLRLDFSFIIFYFFATHWTNRNQVFSNLGHILSQLSKVININFAFGKVHFVRKITT